MKRTKTQFRIYAGMAKTRLGGGFWEQNAGARHTLAALNNPDSTEEQLYRKVAQMLQSGAINPLGECLDHDYMAGLDDAARQRYVLGMSQKINKNIERFNKEMYSGMCS